MDITKQKIADSNDNSIEALIPRGLTTLCDTLAENMIRTLPFELLDEAVEVLIRGINARVMKKYGHGLFKAALLMEVREKVICMEAEGPTRCEPNLQHRHQVFPEYSLINA